MIIKGGIVYIEGKWRRDYDIRVEQGKITALMSPGERCEDQVVDVKGQYVSPGFIDIHIHGCVGVDAMNGTTQSLTEMARFVSQHGTTSFLPTTVTMPMTDITKALEAVYSYQEGQHSEGADILGVHLEGPWIHPKAKGAQAEEYILSPQKEVWQSWPEHLRRLVRLVTLAPELEGAEDFIHFLKGHGITVSLGHTTADYPQVVQSFAWGVSHASHFYNAMTPLNHREPGVVGAVLDLKDMTLELIADLIHVHPAALRLAVRVKGPEKVVLITDSMEAAGLGDGEYVLGNQKIFVKQGAARLEAGNLAGSTLTQDQALRNMVSIGLPAEDVIKMLTETPAAVIGEEHRKGRIHAGFDADLVVLDQDFHVVSTFVKGRNVYTQADYIC